ncbi:MAG: UTP--glucose-1-phosphate uridylyltransferase GalU [Sphingomonadales bacterium]|jgi:UTP--glucose-1-phosphate uridylyltransferase
MTAFAPVRKAVFPVGGLGTRFLPATKSMPKEMLPVVDKPLIQYAVEEAKAAGIEEFIFVTGRGKSAIEDHFDYSFELQQTLSSKGKSDMLGEVLAPVMEPGQICYVRQQEPLGLGHAVWCARHLIGDEPFAILLADDLIKSKTSCLKQMVDLYAQKGGNVVAAMSVPKEHISRYGVIDPGGTDDSATEVWGLVEKPKVEDAPSNLAVIGRYILQPEVFEHLSALERGSGDEVQLTDAMAKLIADQAFHGLEFEGKRFDCGDKVGYLSANVAYALDRADLKDEFKAYLQNLQQSL